VSRERHGHVRRRWGRKGQNTPVQSTLLGIAIVIIVGLVAALVGPLFIDWGYYRSDFEGELTRLVGLPVRVTGPIDARLLPTPMVSLQGIVINGPPGQSPKLNAQSLDVELALGPLMRGQLRAAALHLGRPEFTVGLDENGKIDGPPLPIGLDSDRLAIDHLVIDNGRMILREAASGTRVVLDQLWFNGDMRSLAGPMSGEGAFVSSGQLYGYRLTTGRRGDDGGTKIRLSVEPADRPLVAETEGTLWVDHGAPRFEGSATLARPVGVALAAGKKVVSEPWHLSSHIRANSAGALLEQLEFDYGPEERAIKLTGTADLHFGLRPRFEGVLSARQVDLDHSFSQQDDPNRLPIATLRRFAAALGDAVRPPIPVKLGIGIDVLTLGGAALQSVRGDIESDATAWNLQTLEFQAPGFTQVKLSGRLKVTANSAEFVGPAAVDASDPGALVGWIEGLSDAPKMAMGSLRVRGDLTLGSERIAVERLNADADRRAFEGRLAYTFATNNKPARLDAALSAPDVDVDAALRFANAALAGSKLDKPAEIALALDVGRATFAGVEVKGAAANVGVDASGIRIERLSVSDLAGAALNASGRIDSTASPRGALTLAFDAQKLDGVAALAARFAPAFADQIRRVAPNAIPAKLNATLNMDPLPGDPSKTAAKLIVDGKLGATHVNLNGKASGAIEKPSLSVPSIGAIAAVDTRAEGVIESDDGGALAALLGLDRFITVDKRAARMTFLASGSAGGETHVDAKMTAGGFDSTASGTVQIAGRSQKANLDVSASAANVTALHRDASTPAPMSVKTKIVWDGDHLAFHDFNANVVGSPVRGQLGLVFGKPTRIDGAITADSIDVLALIAPALGMPALGTDAQSGSATSQWSNEPFVDSPVAGFEGTIPFTAARATLTPGTVVQKARGVLRFEPSGVALEDGQADLAQGRLLVQADVHRGESGLAAHAQISLANADMAALNALPWRGAGRLSLQVEAKATGLSPATLLGDLSGTGTLSVEGAQFSGLDPAAINAAIAAVDKGPGPVDAGKIGDLVTTTLDAGKLNIPSASGTINIASGRARISSLAVPAKGADVSVSAVLDLIEQSIDARVTLDGPPATNASGSQRPQLSVVFKGPINAPRRNLDTSKFVEWLTLRSVERETKRLEEIQAKEPVGSTVKPATGQSDKSSDLPPSLNVKPAAPSARADRPPRPLQSPSLADPLPLQPHQ
jgi:hypothetical protein